MDKNKINRRQFLAAASAGTVAAFTSSKIPAFAAVVKKACKPAILGGKPVRDKPFAGWPIIDRTDERYILAALRSGHWSRGKLVLQVEERFTKLMGAKYGLLTGSGTQALNTAVHVLGIGAGDEVITTPYTFVATVEAAMLEDALPIFADIDPETFQIDPSKIEEKITENTKAILPVHINGGACDMDRINAIAKKHNLKVIEDACQAHFTQWKGKNVGTLSDLGCFSFQTSKVLSCGEGGAVLGDDEAIIDRCYSFHNFGRPHGKFMSRDKGGHPILGTKYRISTIHAALLNAQLNRVDEQITKRNENANYLTSKLQQIPGIEPKKRYKEETRSAYYKYAFRYKKEHFNGLPRDKFCSAVKAEGVHCSCGLGVLEGLPLHREGLIEDTLNSRTYRKIYSKQRLDKYREENHCPESDKLAEQVAGFSGNFLLGTKQDMDDIYNAVLKVYENSKELAG